LTQRFERSLAIAQVNCAIDNQVYIPVAVEISGGAHEGIRGKHIICPLESAVTITQRESSSSIAADNGVQFAIVIEISHDDRSWIGAEEIGHRRSESSVAIP
jgi:hypothetical protein